MHPVPKSRRLVSVPLDLGGPLQDGEHWWDFASCAQIDTEAWFPVKGGNPKDPKRICLTVCPVREQCLNAAGPMDTGLWGGLSDRERRRLHKGEPGWDRR